MSGELKDYRAMTSHCDRLLELKPDSLTALQGLAMVAFAQGEFDKAAEHCAAIVSYSPDSFEGWFNLGLAYAQLPGRAADAIGEFQIALRMKPDSALAHFRHQPEGAASRLSRRQSLVTDEQWLGNAGQRQKIRPRGKSACPAH